MKTHFINNEKDFTPAVEKVMSADVLGIDSETTGYTTREGDMRLLSVAPSAEESYVFDVRELPNCNFSFLPDLFADETKIKILQNAKFDLQFFYKFIGELFPVEGLNDTMLISTLLARGDKNLRHSLKEIAARELNRTIEKDLQSSDFSREISDAQIQYAGSDATILHEIRDAQRARVDTLNLRRVCRIECDATATIADAEYKGIYLDTDSWNERATSQTRLYEELREAILKTASASAPQTDLFGMATINLNSPKQVLDMFRDAGIRLSDTDEDTLVKYRDKHELVDAFLKYRKLETSLKKFGTKYLRFVDPVTQRIHASFRQIEAASGRMSCGSPNLQQIPSGDTYRSSFRAERGVLIKADYSQVELRIMARRSGDPVMTQVFQNNEDMHNVTAHRVLGEPLENPAKAQRKLAKNLNFGTGYGCSPGTFACIAGIPVEEAEFVMSEYWKVYRVLKQYQDEQARLAASTGIVYTMSGRTAAMEPVSRENWTQRGQLERFGRNFGIQGTGADILKTALYRLRRRVNLEKFPMTVVNIVHDEIVCECDGDPEVGARIVKEEMESAGQEYLEHIPCVVDVEYKKSWG